MKEASLEKGKGRSLICQLCKLKEKKEKEKHRRAFERDLVLRSGSGPRVFGFVL
jgi:hypothetical protein